MGIATSKNNDELVDNLVRSGYLITEDVELSFRLVDRGRFFPETDREDAYRDSAWRSDNDSPGRIHLSAPSMYANVLENLMLEKGLSFLNVGSGTGYLSTVVGFLIGRGGINHGIEIYDNVVEYAEKCLQDTLKTPEVMAFNWCIPQFFQGNAFQMKSNMRYDRIYCGALVPTPWRNFFCNLLKENGILLMPYEDNLQRITRLSKDDFTIKDICVVRFSPMVLPNLSAEVTSRPATILFPNVHDLREICCHTIRHHIRQSVLQNEDYKLKLCCKLRNQNSSAAAATSAITTTPSEFEMEYPPNNISIILTNEIEEELANQEQQQQQQQNSNNDNASLNDVNPPLDMNFNFVPLRTIDVRIHYSLSHESDVNEPTTSSNDKVSYGSDSEVSSSHSNVNRQNRSRNLRSALNFCEDTVLRKKISSRYTCIEPIREHLRTGKRYVMPNFRKRQNQQYSRIMKRFRHENVKQDENEENNEIQLDDGIGHSLDPPMDDSSYNQQQSASSSGINSVSSDVNFDKETPKTMDNSENISDYDSSDDEDDPKKRTYLFNLRKSGLIAFKRRYDELMDTLPLSKHLIEILKSI